MKLLQVALAASLLFGSSFAFAAKPQKAQEINTGPVWQGNVIGCYASNTTDGPINADITIYYYDPLDKATKFNTINVTIDPYSVRHNSVPEVNRGGWCKISWTGEVGDLRGTACSFIPDGQFVGCSDAY